MEIVKVIQGDLLRAHTVFATDLSIRRGSWEKTEEKPVPPSLTHTEPGTVAGDHPAPTCNGHS